MPLTRHPARSSFTFEIKRTNRRAPEVITISKTPARSGSSLADQVFGRVSGSPRDLQPDAIELRTPVFEIVEIAPPEMDRMVQGPVERRRVLPDLVTPLVDPVVERMQRDKEERAARRRTRRTSRSKSETGPATVAQEVNSTLSPVAAAPEPAPVLPVTSGDVLAAAVRQPITTDTADRVDTRRTRKWDEFITGLKKAERTGGPMPRVPVGQRWKRRLPKACW